MTVLTPAQAPIPTPTPAQAPTPTPTPAPTPAAAPAPGAPTDADLLAEVLAPYRPNCRYLREATVFLRDGLPAAQCTFHIPESCYIDDTGHFNSVEFNICYNQMAYYLIAKSVRDALVAPFDRWDLDDFRERQLSSILISHFESTFRRPMDGRRFHGEIAVTSVRERDGADGRQPLVLAESTCRYWDDGRGRADGKVRFVVVDPPRR
ncbi:FcoT family thioesterase [Streptomyces sp. SBR177]